MGLPLPAFFKPLFVTPRAAAYWKQYLGIDLRTLALLRVMLALTFMAELVTMWPSIFAIFDERGIFPRKDAFLWQNDYFWSLFYISGRVEWAYFLFGLGFLASFALLIGYRTRIVTVICWVLALSVSTRIVIFTSGAHMFVPILFFWAMFLPLGARFSVDAALSTQPRQESNAYLSTATAAYLMQMTCLYVFSALLKTHPMWYSTGDAIYYVMNSHDIRSPLAPYLAQWPQLMRWLTLYVYYLEFVAVFFLWLPVKNAWSRLLIWPFLFTLHLGFVFFLAIGFFPLVCMAGITVFIPGAFWDKVLPWFNARRKRAGIKIYYDRDCGFCRKTCQIFRELGLPSDTPIRPAQDFPDIYAIMQRDNSWVVEDGAGLRRTRWEAVAWCWRRSPILWPLGILFLPRFMRPVGDFIYHLIAAHRGRLSKLTARFLPEHDSPRAFHPHPVTQVVVAVLAAMVLAWNIATLPNYRLGVFDQPIGKIVSLLYLRQQMNFFAPFPYQLSRWVVVEGHLADGRIVDMQRLSMQSPSHTKPNSGYDAYPDHYWYKFYHRVHFGRWRWVLGRYFCNAWKEKFPLNPVEKMVLTAYEQRTAPPGKPPNPQRAFATITYNCKEKK